MIFVSAGHHPSAPGAKFKRFIEHDEAVIWADDLVSILGNKSIRVPNGVLRSKVDFINSRFMNGDVAIEIHFNSTLYNIGNGCQTLYMPNHRVSKRVAEEVQTALSEVFDPDLGVSEGWYRDDESRGPDFFLAKTNCTAIIVQPDFVHNLERIIAQRSLGIEVLAEALRGY